MTLGFGESQSNGRSTMKRHLMYQVGVSTRNSMAKDYSDGRSIGHLRVISTCKNRAFQKIPRLQLRTVLVGVKYCRDEEDSISSYRSLRGTPALPGACSATY